MSSAQPEPGPQSRTAPEGEILIGVEQASHLGDESIADPVIAAIANNPPSVVVEALHKDYMVGAGDSRLQAAYDGLEDRRMNRILPRILKPLGVLAAGAAVVALIGGLKYSDGERYGTNYAPIVAGNSFGFDEHGLPSLAEKNEAGLVRHDPSVTTGLAVITLGLAAASAVGSGGATNPTRIRKDAQKIIGKN